MVNPTYFYRIGNFALRKNIPFVPWLMHRLCFLICHADIPMSCKIGKNVQFGHFGMGVAINEVTTIEDNVIIYHGVTIGRARGIDDSPEKSSRLESIVIGRNSLIGAYAIILPKEGKFSIGENCEIGAGAIVLESMPSNSFAVCERATIRSRKAEHATA